MNSVPPERNTFNPMKRMCYPLVAVILFMAGCKKEEVKEYNVTLDASCWDCIVQYAAGSDHSTNDTLLGSVNGNGDTLVEAGRYTLVFKEGENLFFRACRIRPDTAFGDIELRASGQIQPVSATAGSAVTCATINQLVQVQ